MHRAAGGSECLGQMLRAEQWRIAHRPPSSPVRRQRTQWPAELIRFAEVAVHRVPQIPRVLHRQRIVVAQRFVELIHLLLRRLYAQNDPPRRVGHHVQNEKHDQNNRQQCRQHDDRAPERIPKQRPHSISPLRSRISYAIQYKFFHAQITYLLRNHGTVMNSRSGKQKTQPESLPAGFSLRLPHPDAHLAPATVAPRVIGHERQFDLLR